MKESQLLLVDDEEAILQMLVTILKKEQFHSIDTATTAKQALALCRSKRYDLIFLDVMLPDRSGFDICPLIRETSNASIFFLTARTTDLDKLSGFALGADDYITKPFNPLEVVARVKAHLRRRQKVNNVDTLPMIYEYGSIRVNMVSGEVFVKNKQVTLPAQVYQLLLFFCQHPNQLFSKSQLYEKVWGEQFYGEDNTVMVHMRKLRERMEVNPSHPIFFVTIRGLGYKFVPGGVGNERT